jgi:ribosomal protein S18 acetylase RimI-like enzyme
MKRKGIGNRESGIALPGTGNGERGTVTPRGTSVPGSPFPVPSAPVSRIPHPASLLSVRQATGKDLPAILALRLALLREHSHNAIYGRLRPDAEPRAAKLFAAQLQSPNEVIFLAEMGGEAVGVLRCIHSAGSPLLDPPQYAYISSVYVVPRAREQGVLRELLAAADDWCADRGLDEMRLHNAADNPLANAAWEALGFEVVEHLRVRSLKPR